VRFIRGALQRFGRSGAHASHPRYPMCGRDQGRQSNDSPLPPGNAALWAVWRSIKIWSATANNKIDLRQSLGILDLQLSSPAAHSAPLTSATASGRFLAKACCSHVDGTTRRSAHPEGTSSAFTSARPCTAPIGNLYGQHTRLVSIVTWRGIFRKRRNPDISAPAAAAAAISFRTA